MIFLWNNMSNRRENLKKSLGITEYPWSSDDDDDNPPISQSMTDMILQRSANTQRSSSGTMPGTSDQLSSSSSSHVPPPPPPPPPPPTATSTPTRPTTSSERDLFWSIINNNPRRTTNINVSRMSSSDNANLTRHTPASELREASVDRSRSAADIQRIMTIKKLTASTRSFNQGPKTTVNIIVPRNGATSSSMRNHANELIANLKASRARRLRGNETANTSRNNLSHCNSRIPLWSSHSAEEVREEQPSTSGLSRSLPPQGELDPADAPLPSTNLDHSDEEAEIYSTARLSATSNSEVTENAEGNTMAEVSLEEIVEIDAEPSGDHENHNTNPQQPTASAETAENSTSPEEQPHGVKRKLIDEVAEPTIKEFNQSLLRLLECPVCMEWLEPPMSQCRRGHLVCARCRARLSACPVCRIAFSSVRNRAMEAVAEMLRYPCRHGCGCELRLRRRAAHEASCACRLYSCLAPACTMRSLALPLLLQHTKSKHLPMVKIGQKHKFSMKVNSEQHSIWFVMAFQELFHLRVDVDIRTWGIFIYVAYIGPKCNSRKYTYEVSVVGQHNSRKLMYTRATHSDLESSTLNVSRQDCFHLTLDQAMNFLRLKNRHCVPDKFLDFHVEIGKCEIDAKDDSDS